MLGDPALCSPSLDLWIRHIILLAPFIPFLILFCNVVETSDSSDLDYLQRFVDTLHRMAQYPRYATCSKQLRILSALYDVAAKYVEAKARGKSGDMIDGHFTDLDFNNYVNGDEFLFSNDDANQASGFQSRSMQAQIPDDFVMELDTPGAQLESWFHQSHQMMRLLDGS